MQKEIYMDRKRSLIDVATPLIAGDYGAYKIVFQRNKSDQIAGMEIEALRPDNVTITDLGRVYDDRCEYVIKTSMYSVPGQVRIRASVLHSDGKLTINEMLFVAKGEFPGGQEVPEDRIPALTSALQYAAEQGQYAETQGDFAKAQGDYAKTQGEYAKAQGDYAATHAGGDMKTEVFAKNAMAGQGVVDRAVTADGMTKAFHINGVAVDGTGDVTLTKADIGLGSVDNTADAAKPVSSAQQAALDGKVDKVDGKGLSTNDYTTAEKEKLAGIESGAQVNDVTSVAGRTGNVVLTKMDIGLSNVDNTSDATKPVSTAQQAALDGKANVSDVLTKTNAAAFTPSGDYQPATKKYVDDAVKAGGGGGGSSGDAQKVYTATWTAESKIFAVTGVSHITALEEGASIRVAFPSITGSNSGAQLKVNDLAAKIIRLDALRVPDGFGVRAVHDLVYYDNAWVVVGANTAHNATFTGDFNLSNSNDVGLSDYVRFVAESEQCGMKFTVHDDVDYNYVRIGVTANPVSIPTIETYDMLGGITQSGVFYTSINDPMKTYDATLSGSTYSVSDVAHVTALDDGVQVRVRFGDGVSGACTLNVNGLGAKGIYTDDSSQLTSVNAGTIADLVYYAGNWHLTGHTASSSGGGGGLPDCVQIVEFSNSTDDLAKLQAAYAALPSTGGTIVLRGKGNIVLTDNFGISATKPLYVDAYSARLVISSTYSGTTNLFGAVSSPFQLCGGSYTVNQCDQSIYIVDFNGCTQGLLRDCTINNQSLGGGVSVVGVGGNIFIINNTIAVSGGNRTGYVINMSEVSYLVVSDNVLSGKYIIYGYNIMGMMFSSNRFNGDFYAYGGLEFSGADFINNVGNGSVQQLLGASLYEVFFNGNRGMTGLTETEGVTIGVNY